MWDWIALASSTRKYAIDLCTTISPYYPTCWYVHLHVPTTVRASSSISDEPNGEVFLGVCEEEFVMLVMEFFW
jgi:hypothetical protein